MSAYSTSGLALLLLPVAALLPAGTVGCDGAAPSSERMDETGTLWRPYLAWSISNASYAGNPFDVVATVEFQHLATGAAHTTAMFYDGGDTWTWRFTGTHTGLWAFVTVSDDPELDGHWGTVTIEPNADAGAYGFTTAQGTQWARYRGNERELEAFIPQLVMYRPRPADFGNVPMLREDIQTFFGEHGFNGFHVPSIAGRWFDAEGGRAVTAAMKNPDPATFEALERLITRVHAAGGVVHLWAWGDRERGQTPEGLEGGANGAEDRRLQRYIAARLGPLPGWSMGYGFDLDEWASLAQVKGWHDYLEAHMGWAHFVGGRPGGPNQGLDHTAFAVWNQAFDYASYEHHQPDYAVYVAALQAAADKPVLSEDRFRIQEGGRPEIDYDMERVRRGLWQSAMAGGVANIWGNLRNRPRTEGSGPFPRPEWVATYHTFFETERRFRLDLERADGLSPDADTRVLRSSDRRRYVLYREDAVAIRVDLSEMERTGPAVAVNTTRAYEEVELGRLEPRPHTIDLPTRSDWAVAVGAW